MDESTFPLDESNLHGNHTWETDCRQSFANHESQKGGLGRRFTIVGTLSTISFPCMFTAYVMYNGSFMNLAAYILEESYLIRNPLFFLSHEDKLTTCG